MGERFSHHIADKLEHLSQKTLIQATDANDEWDQKTAKHLAHCPKCLTKFIGYPDNQGSETTLVMAKQFAQDNSGVAPRLISNNWDYRSS
jgi:hypothetical protein